MDSLRLISEYWPLPTPGTDIDILANYDPDDPDGVLGRRLSRLHELFWGAPGSPHTVTIPTTIPDAGTLKPEKNASVSEIIELSDDAVFPNAASMLLIHNTYKTFWDLLSKEEEDWERRHRVAEPFSLPSHATVISGQPGTGK